jgi:hypothetical protein
MFGAKPVVSAGTATGSGGIGGVGATGGEVFSGEGGMGSVMERANAKFGACASIAPAMAEEQIIACIEAANESQANRAA